MTGFSNGGKPYWFWPFESGFWNHSMIKVVTFPSQSLHIFDIQIVLLEFRQFF
jgi:hypothetical protein